MYNPLGFASYSERKVTERREVTYPVSVAKFLSRGDGNIEVEGRVVVFKNLRDVVWLEFRYWSWMWMWVWREVSRERGHTPGPMSEGVRCSRRRGVFFGYIAARDPKGNLGSCRRIRMDTARGRGGRQVLAMRGGSVWGGSVARRMSDFADEEVRMAWSSCW